MSIYILRRKSHSLAIARKSSSALVELWNCGELLLPNTG